MPTELPIDGFTSTIKKTQMEQQSLSEIACRNWQNYNKCGYVCM